MTTCACVCIECLLVSVELGVFEFFSTKTKMPSVDGEENGEEEVERSANEDENMSEDEEEESSLSSDESSSESSSMETSLPFIVANIPRFLLNV